MTEAVSNLKDRATSARRLSIAVAISFLSCFRGPWYVVHYSFVKSSSFVFFHSSGLAI
jgi:hypothetical protein